MRTFFLAQAARWKTWLSRIAALVVVSPALYQLFLELRLFASRVRYPMDLEWLEGPALYQAYRMMRGWFTYGPPGEGYLPLFHPPGYPTVLAGVGFLFGLDYPVARVVSFSFFLLAIVLLARQVVKHEEDRLLGLVAGLLGAGCAAAGVPLFEGFSDLVRGDTLALFLCVLAGSLAIDAERKMTDRRVAIIALLLAALVYVRLPAIFMPTWTALFVLLRHRPTGLRLAIVTTAIAGLVLVGALFATRGWYWIYTVSLNQSHAIPRDRWFLFGRLIFGFSPFIVVLPVVALVLALKRRLSARAGFWTGMLVAGTLAACLPYVKVGGYANDLMPIPLLVGPAAMLLALDVVKALGGFPRIALATRWSLFAGMAAFLALRFWDPTPFIPSPAMWEKAKRLNEYVARLPGDVFIPRAPFLPVRHGKGPHQISDMPYLDAAWARFGDVRLDKYLDMAHAPWAIVAGNEVPYTAGEIAARYQLHERINDGTDPVIGERVRLSWLLKWMDDTKDAQVLFDFEDPELPGFVREGEAFEKPSTLRRPSQNYIANMVGSGLANSYHPTGRDRSVGTLTSPEFVIDRPHIALRVGGGWRNRTRVELRVGGKVVASATGIFQYSEVLVQVVWNVARFKGQTAQLVLRDEDKEGWGHLLVDHVITY